MLEKAELKEAFRAVFEISDLCNKAFQAAEPWKTRTSEPEKAANLIYNLCYVIKDLMIMAHPYMPAYTQKVMSFFGKAIADPVIGTAAVGSELTWSDIGQMEGLETVGETEVFFTPMDKKTMELFRDKFSGTQAERKDEKKAKAKKEEKSAKNEEPALAEDQAAHFAKFIRLKVAKIVSVERNPDSDKLYVEHLDDGNGEDRIIQSGLVQYLTPDELIGKHIILADNLNPRKMRGIESRGMLLAADYKDDNGKDCVEVLTAPWAAPGTEVVLDGDSIASAKPDAIDADVFFQVEIKVVDKHSQIAGKNLTAAGKAITTEFTVNGGVN